MLKINWLVRAKNKAFWFAIIPTGFLLVQQLLALFGITMDFSNLVDQILEIVNTVFVLMAIVGIVVDPTTDGFNDSKRALKYTEPKEE